MNTSKDLAQVREFINTENYENFKPEEQLAFICLKTNMVNLTTTKVVVDIANRANCKVLLHAPVVYTPDNVKVHYKEIYDKYMEDPTGKFKFFEDLVEYWTRGPVYGIVIQCPKGVAGAKALCGSTANPEPGTMRFESFKALDKPYDIQENGIHMSGKVNEAQREIANFLQATTNHNPYTLDSEDIVNDISEYISTHALNASEDTFNL